MQNKPDYLNQLIEAASAKAGSDYKLALELGVPRQNLSAWKHGKKTCPAGDVALMAEIAGMDPVAWGARAIAASYAGTPKGEKLAAVLGKALLVTGAALVTSGANAAVAGSSYFIRCIERLIRGQHSPRAV
jgi:DNA-binding transcriptional regulator YdaS (Cro superfamily)